MHPTQGNKRFWGSTRGRIITLLRRASRTVDELAQTLDLTDNAVRAQIATLKQDGLVEQRGVRRSTSKPAYAYDLTPEAEQLFPKAYAPALAQLL
ncbi:MAG: helix-turn-helix domain-containing protein, partial [Thermomicrobia bacterium]|nr:helix-turn-helix domain-containing protein [Thermomicrobia bacterium]